MANQRQRFAQLTGVPQARPRPTPGDLPAALDYNDANSPKRVGPLQLDQTRKQLNVRRNSTPGIKVKVELAPPTPLRPKKKPTLYS